jgi:hypothetical protein
VKERERLHSIELDPNLTQAYADIFISRWDCYPLQLKNGTYTQVRARLTLTHVFDHLTSGHLIGYQPFTIGAYALNAHNQAKWLCFETGGEAQWVELQKLAGSLREVDVPTYLESSRRGGHLWLFTPLLSGGDIRQFARKLLVMQRIAEYGEDKRRRVTVYPKQAVLGEGPGSFVRLPLGVDRKTGRIDPFVDLEGKPLASTIREQMKVLAQPARVPQAFINVILAKVVEVPPPPPKPSPKFKKRKPRHNEPLSESLKHAISVFDFVSQFIHLNDQGKGLCPFHDDQARSFAVNKEGNYWHCFGGCGGGSLIDFWMKWREKHGQENSFAATVKDLREMLLS